MGGGGREIERDGREEERKRGNGRKTLGKGGRGDLMTYEMAGEVCRTKEEKRKEESGMGTLCRRRQYTGRKAERKGGQGKEIRKKRGHWKEKKGAVTIWKVNIKTKDWQR